MKKFHYLFELLLFEGASFLGKSGDSTYVVDSFTTLVLVLFYN